MGHANLPQYRTARTGLGLARGRGHLAQPRTLWDASTVIPSCWPHHPHLVHEIAVLADQRRKAGAPLQVTGSKSGTGTPCRHSSTGCAPGSKTTARKATNGGPPAAATRDTSDATSRDRQDIYSRDAQTTIRLGTSPRERPRLEVVNLETGEITDGPR